MKILLADDEVSITATLEDDLRDAGHDVLTVRNGEDALVALKQGGFDVVISDIAMPRLKGDDLLVQAKALDPSLVVILMTGFGTIESAVNAMKAGAADYILKPFHNDTLVASVARIGEVRALRRENEQLKQELEEVAPKHGLVGSSPAMRELHRLVDTCGRSDASVLITGETGCGKEVVARAVHAASSRRAKPFVAVSCAAMVPTLLESELFGHEKGAFTDARDTKLGRFERANHGTVFLDDIDDMPLETQVKLLRVLQEREIERLGGTKTIKLDIRVVTATKVDLREWVKAGKFRQDLFFRLNVINLRIPPLRERREDIPALAKHFVRVHSDGRGYEFEPGAFDVLKAGKWPGNVRELEHAVERGIALAAEDGILRAENMIEGAAPAPVASVSGGMTLGAFVEQAERAFILETLRAHDWRKAESAQHLGISRKALWQRCRKLGIDVDSE